MRREVVRMEGISKYFPGVKALDAVDFSLYEGEVMALVGENGAGKSTLMKILSGLYQKDEGQIFYEGELVEITDVKSAMEMGIILIHQELNLMRHLTVAQNIFIGRERKSENSFFVKDSDINSKTKEIFQELEIDISPTAIVGELTVAQQQMVEIAKALSFESKVLIMDEPTASLTDAEIENLFRIIKKLKGEGTSIVYISHRLEELKEITDYITVMRDGLYIDTVETSQVEISAIINMMVGREIFVEKTIRTIPNDAPIALEVRNLNAGRMVKDVSFSVKKGEILGIAGLMGAGRSETARAIFGVDKPDSGEVFINGEKANISHPKDGVEYGIGFLSEDRKEYGLVLNLDVEMNTSLASMKDFTKHGIFIDFQKSKDNAVSMVKKMNIKTPSINQRVENLSGGNQQKVVVGKWLTRECDILIFDEPTRGIDVGAKNEIYNMLIELADEGKAIIVISSELPEIIRISDRVIVMCEGRVTGEVVDQDITQEKIMYYATKREA